MTPLLRISLALMFAASLAGCAGSSIFIPYPKVAKDYRLYLKNGDVDQIAMYQNLSEGQQTEDALLYHLERGRLAQWDARFNQSRQDFDWAIGYFDSHDLSATVDISDSLETGSAFLSNDTAISYRGEPYERVFVHHFQTFNYLHQHDLEGAGVELRRAQLEQRILEEQHVEEIAKAKSEAEDRQIPLDQVAEQFSGLDTIAGRVKSAFQNGYTFYLSAAFWEANGELNDALVDYKKALELNPKNRQIETDVRRVSLKIDGKDEVSENGSIFIFLEEGLIPEKVEREITVPTFNGALVSVAFPSYQTEDWPVSSAMGVTLEDDAPGNGVTTSTQIISDVGAMAVKNLREGLPSRATRQILRAVSKYQLQRKTARQLGVLGQVAANLYNVVSERADLRSWLTLPHTVQAARIEVKPGTQHLSLSYRGRRASLDLDVRPGETVALRVLAAGNNLRWQPYSLNRN